MQVKIPLETIFTHIATGSYSMHSGKYCSMMSSLKCIDMELSANVTMGLIINSILTYLLIQLTIPKSE